MNKLVKKHLSDYSPPSFDILSIHLTIEIHDKKTIVTSQLVIKKLDEASHLILHGENQRLLFISLNHHRLTENQYRLDDETLTILNVTETFELKIQSEIKPHENTALSGLYQSGELFCTQCEPEGFRRITYYLDRPDVMSLFTTKIIADKTAFPVLLANGNCIETGVLENNRHFAVWHDPFKKPSYLFAMVAGKLGFVEDFFETMSGKKVTIRIYSEIGNQEKCQHALTSVKKAMRWDEEHYGREYDLDIFMIVAVHDFNFGAMENKGLNIFNAKYILVDPKTATDIDYFNVDRVVAHEYFHNWTGDRVTLRDWFQICLKEGLTSFREQSFCEDMSSQSTVRIDDAELLRSNQFPEDAGPMAHPIRPESYLEINNFYTMTVYEKGAEVIRMLKNIVGNKHYREGTDLYFNRYDGQAVTCEDFLKCIEDASGIDLHQFRLWYSQAGTPELSIQSNYDEHKKQYALTIKQNIPDTPGQKNKKPMLIPLKMSLLDPAIKSRGDGGMDPAVKPRDDGGVEKTLLITKPQETFIFENIETKPIPSLLRDFSAPVKINYEYSNDELITLIHHDTNGFVRWESMQIYLFKKILDFKHNSLTELFALFEKILIQAISSPRDLIAGSSMNIPLDPAVKPRDDEGLDPTLTARLLTLPSEKYLAEQMKTIDVDLIHDSRHLLQKNIAKHLSTEFLKLYYRLNDQKPYQYSNESVEKRSLKNTCLHYLCLNGNIDLAFKQFETANNMTDKIAALVTLSQLDCEQYKTALAQFYKEYQLNALVIDKWFSVQALSPLPHTLETVKMLLNHPDFTIKNPNRARALLGTFGQNQVRFHAISGEGYALLTDYLLKIDPINPMLSSRLIEPLTHWNRYDKKRQWLMKAQLERLKATKTLSKNLVELVEKINQ